MTGAPSHLVLIVSGVRGDTRRYRAFHLHQQLRIAGVSSELSHTTDPRLPGLISRADVLVLHRVAFDPYVAGLIAQVRRRGGLILVDADDLVFDPQAFQWIDSPDFRDPVRAVLYKAEMARHRQTLEAADGALASTAYLADTIRSLGKPAWVHRNAASLELARWSAHARRTQPAAAGKLILGYASGTPTHNHDFASIAPVLQEALRSKPEMELWIIGFLDLDSSWHGLSSRLRRFDPVNWRRLPEWLCQLDINLAPLVEGNPFSQSKSEIKFMEAALVGVPTLASPTDAFKYAIRDGENGFLASGPQEWADRLVRLRQVDSRLALARQARHDALAGYTAQVRSHQAVNVLNEIAAHLGCPFRWEYRPVDDNRLDSYDWDPALERKPGNIDMGVYTLQRRGIRPLAGQLWIFFRRWLARYFPYS